MKSVQQKLVNLLKSPRRMNAFLSAGIILGIFAYGVGIISTTVYIADAKSDSRSIAELESDIAELENKYFRELNTINQDEAEVFGLYQVEDVEYAHAQPQTQLALNQ